jgi:hypothetical protein
MDDRLRSVEGEVHTLKDWRLRTVDPWISSGKEFRETVGEYITTLKAREAMTDRLNEERHIQNSFKLNILIVAGGLLTALFTGLLIVATYQVAHQHTFMLPHLMGSNTTVDTALRATIPPLN